MASNVLLSLCAMALAGALYFISRGTTRRRIYRNLPGPPHSLFWGHLKVIDEYMSKLPPGSYLQAAFTQMKQDFDLPDVFYLDLWPFGPGFILCTGPDAAAIPTTVNAMAQADVVTDYFADSIGETFIEASNGALWKELHQMLAPGLTPAAVKTYHHLMIDEAKTLHDRFRKFASAGQVINYNMELGKQPFDVIFRIFFGKSQRTQSEDSQLYKDLNGLADVIAVLKSVGSSKNPITRWRATREKKQTLKRIENELEGYIHPRFSELEQQEKLPTRTSATNLLDRMLLSQVQSGLPLDRRLIKLILENAKGFLIAGYGTTSDTLTYATMLLAAFPEALRKVQEEHDQVFDKDFDKTLEMLRQDPTRIKDLEYTAAAINETLRLFPIGMVARQPPPDMEFFEYKGRKYPVKDHTFMIGTYLIHYDPNVFDQPKEFRPERYLAGDASFPRNAHRPFERGLRSCVGQNLAMDQMKIVLLMVARWFDFELRDHAPAETPRLGHTDLDTKLGIHAFQTQKFSSGPRTASMRIHITERD